ncbi:TylF/MycF/NovP-related O-methyltransferase, partial [Rhodococcus erythropolis]|nr:TylF/MycF/NovP-related O-methyltransferase [Rhodococcus erythropolis]
SGPVAFLHLDADLYSSTKTVLDLLGDRLVPGSIVVFDEFFNYPGWQQHEYRAWTEFVTRTGISFEYLGYTVDNEQVIVEITS